MGRLGTAQTRARAESSAAVWPESAECHGHVPTREAPRERRPRVRFWVFGSILALCACSASPADELAGSRSALIYGADDRRDVYAVGDVALRELALQSTVALMPESSMSKAADGSLVLEAETLRDKFAVCDSEPFAAQPSLAVCSGVLLGEDLVLTAAHCVQFLPCESELWAFGYALLGESDVPRLQERDVYRCRSVPLLRYETTSDGLRLDYAVVQLDRPVSPDKRAPSIATKVIPAGENATVIGYPSGLPAKIDCGATVVDARKAEHDYLSLASDTFLGSSGSGVFNKKRGLVAIVVRGGEDYEHDAERGCSVTRRLPGVSDRPDAEQASYVGKVVASLCESGWASEALCDRRSRCGDGQCSLDEHTGPCASDCPVRSVFVAAGYQVRGGCSSVPGGFRFASWELVALAALIRARTRPARGA